MKSAQGAEDPPVGEEIDSIRAYLDRGAPWDACDAFRDAVAARPEACELLYWGALAHARAGATQIAHALLDRCDAGSLSPALRVEALSLRGRLWKDAYQRAPGARGARQVLQRAHDEYLEAYRIARSAYPGINAASLAMIAGDREEAAKLAREVLAALPAGSGASTWDIATRAEAQVLVGDLASAGQSYAEAYGRAEGNAGMVASMRRQLRVLARAIPHAIDLLVQLRAPDVVAFAGHLLDDDGRPAPRFPRALVPHVRDVLERHVAELHQPIVFASAACGADLLFLEAAIARGAEVNVVLPFAREDFVRTSVAAGGDEWVRRFDAVIARATRVIMATDEAYLGDVVLFEHGARLVEGFSRLRAAQLETSPSLLCVLDMASDEKTGGTRQSYRRWRESGDALHVVDIAALRAQHVPAAPRRAGPAPISREVGAPSRKGGSDQGEGRRFWKALMFADFAGFSRVQDVFAPRFHELFLDIGAREIAESATAPLDAKTWGDALYVVFDDMAHAADFALRFLEATLAADWSDAGMAATSRVRVALHAGPVYRGYDPVMRRPDFFGSSVTRAARIEPVTQPGTVYASEPFAATLAAAREAAFTLEYIGRMPLAKGYGESRIYRVDRACPTARASIVKRTSTRSRTWSAPPKTENGTMPKSD